MKAINSLIIIFQSFIVGLACATSSANIPTHSELLAIEKNVAFLRNRDPEKAISLSQTAISQLNSEDSAARIIKINFLNHLSYAHIVIGEYSKALTTSSHSISLAEKSNYFLGLGRAYKNIAHCYRLIGNYDTSMKFYLKSLEYRRKTNDEIEISRGLNNIALLYEIINNNDEAIKTYQESLKILNGFEDSQYTAYAHGGISEVYRNLEDYSQALVHANKSLHISSKLNDATGLTIGYNLLGEIQLLSGDLKESEENLLKSIEIANSNHITTSLVEPLINLARIKHRQKDYSAALTTANLALESAQANRELHLQSISYKLISEIYESNQQLSEALENYKSHKNLEDEILNNRSTSNLAAMRTEFELDNLDRQNKLLSQQVELNQTKSEKVIVQRNLIVVFLILVLVIIIFIYHRHIQKRKIQQQATLNRELSQINELKDQFLTNTSHEFRTPLNGIIGLAECLQQELLGPQSEQAKESLAMLCKSGKHLASLVDDIMDFAQLKSQRMQIAPTSIKPYQLINEVVGTCQSLLSKKSVTIVNDVPIDEQPVLADKKRLNQILYNLIGNAIKCSEIGEIRIHTAIEGGYLKFHVSDQGCGIPEDKLESIFEYFEQVDGSASRALNGTGLGLAIVKQLVELHSGRVWVESKLGQGSVFSFTLPSA
jgi:signal transduction histidine kinase